MSILESIILGIIEGITEFLPVSSTGHLIITEKLLGIESDEFVKSFTVIIQFGAILSVILLYWKRFFVLNRITIFDKNVLSGLHGRKKYQEIIRRLFYKFDIYYKLLIAFLPAAVLGFLLSDLIDSVLDNVIVVGVMLIIGGILMTFIEKLFKKNNETAISESKAFKIGLIQCFAMIPGVSRSMSTIFGGLSQGLSRKSATEFSFLLAVPTMLGATLFKLLQMYQDPKTWQLLIDNSTSLLVGCLTAFIVAVAAIKLFISYVSRHDFRVFGYYRIIAGIAVLLITFFYY